MALSIQRGPRPQGVVDLACLPAVPAPLIAGNDLRFSAITIARFPNEVIWELDVDSEGFLWIGLNEHGLLRYNPADGAKFLGRENYSLYEAGDGVEALDIRNIIGEQEAYVAGPLLLEAVDLNQFLVEVLEMHQHQLAEAGVRLEQQWGRSGIIKIQKSKLLTVFNHLIKNACRAMASRDSDRCLTVHADVFDRQARISLCDNGEGIAEEDLKKVFFHGFSTYKQAHGYGLHLCANAVDEMGGALHLESKGKGMGVTAILTLPVIRGDAPRAAATQARTSG